MNLPAALFVIRWMIRDTFRQSVAARTFWLLLIVTGVFVLFCLSVGVQGPRSLKQPGESELIGPDNQPLTGQNIKRAQGRVTLAFGAMPIPIARDAESAIQFLEAVLGTYVAGAFGTLIMLLFTAGFMPEFLQPSAASVLLAKPVPRWSIVVGKYLGVLAFVLFQVTLFIGGTWLALGLRTGIWPAGYLLSIPVVVLHFAIIYSFSALMAVTTRSTVASVFGGVLFWLVCCGVNVGRYFALALPELAPKGPQSPQLSPVLQTVLNVGYWIMPKPLDLMMILDSAMGRSEHLRTFPDLQQVQQMGLYMPELAVITSILSTAVVLVIAARQLAITEY
jgi:ABC-type transport system involved in multi-copper enzyme maturation permease subunit